MYQVLLRQGQGRALDGYIILYMVYIWYFFKITTLIDGKVVAPVARLIVCMLLIRHVWHARSLFLSLSFCRPLLLVVLHLTLIMNRQVQHNLNTRHWNRNWNWKWNWNWKRNCKWISPSLSLSLDVCVLQVEFMCCNETFLQQFLAQLEVRETWQGGGEGQARHVNSRRSNCKTLAHKS